eukprot:2253160-Rhodomonas_salina.1
MSSSCASAEVGRFSGTRDKSRSSSTCSGATPSSLGTPSPSQNCPSPRFSQVAASSPYKASSAKPPKLYMSDLAVGSLP